MRIWCCKKPQPKVILDLPSAPKRSILKNSRTNNGSHDKSVEAKEATFDEKNILETFHPADKDYGHMKIDEPDTPFERSEPLESENLALDQSDLVSRLLDKKPPKILQKSPESEFSKKRNDHYNMKEAMERAKKLIEEES